GRHAAGHVDSARAGDVGRFVYGGCERQRIRHAQIRAHLADHAGKRCGATDRCVEAGRRRRTRRCTRSSRGLDELVARRAGYNTGETAATSAAARPGASRRNRLRPIAHARCDAGCRTRRRAAIGRQHSAAGEHGGEEGSRALSMPTGSGNDGIASRLLRWFDRHGRNDLPWQHPRTPYRVWISEVMLQQTQVATAIPYFERFVRALPDVQALANASEDEVFALWSGLGYYARARNLHRAARACVAHSGELPAEFDALLALPGIGRSTAGASLALSRGERFSILDGNVKRVLARHAGVRGWPGERSVDEELWALTEKNTPHRRIADYTQAIMDLGATVCTRARPRCSECPLSDDCVAFRQGLTAVLPQQRPSRILPERNTVMLILRDARRRVLLQRRG